MEGIFDTINSCEGIYYNPEKKILYEGKIKNEIPLNSTHIQLYNDDAFILYDGEIKEGKYEGNGTEYSNYIKDMILYYTKDNFQIIFIFMNII